MKKIDDFQKLKRLEELTILLSELNTEKQILVAYFDNKRKVRQTIGFEKKEDSKPLLGLFNKPVFNPTGYCDLKCVYLKWSDVREKKCYCKGCNFEFCRHYIELNKNQRKKGIKNAPMNYYNFECNE